MGRVPVLARKIDKLLLVSLYVVLTIVRLAKLQSRIGVFGSVAEEGTSATLE